MITIGNGLQKMLKKRGYNQTEFSRISGLKKPHLSKLYHSHQSPSLRTLVKLSEVLHCSTDELLGRMNE